MALRIKVFNIQSSLNLCYGITVKIYDRGIFVCELGPPEYAMTGPDGVEMSNRWDEAQVIKRWVREIWDELGGDN